MTTKIGMVCGVCPRCDKEICRPRPADLAVCDCWEYCPQGHKMQPYTPDLNPQTYGSIDSAKVHGDLQRPMNVVLWCSICQHYSAQRPVEVNLT